MAIASKINVAFFSPCCGKPVGYQLVREGAVYAGETVGRYGKNSLRCIHCGRPIKIAITFNIARGDK